MGIGYLVTWILMPVHLLVQAEVMVNAAKHNTARTNITFRNGSDVNINQLNVSESCQVWTLYTVLHTSTNRSWMIGISG